jgi:hypothetical protein
MSVSTPVLVSEWTTVTAANARSESAASTKASGCVVPGGAVSTRV